jgi:hypothetical protein
VAQSAPDGTTLVFGTPGTHGPRPPFIRACPMTLCATSPP